jgi:uncharacterized protein (TIGR03118 family)
MVQNRALRKFRLSSIVLIGVLLSGLPSIGKRTVVAVANGKSEPITFGGIVRQTNLVSDLPGVALVEDRLLTNPWGIALSSDSPFWVANNAKPLATLYRGGVGNGPLVINAELPRVGIVPPESVVPIGTLATGVVANSSNSFPASLTPTSPAAPAKFIFVTLNGAINAWQPAMGNTATVQKFIPGHKYTGVTIGNNGSADLLYAADFENGKIDVFDGNYNPTTLSGNFTDTAVLSGYHPYNIQNLNGALYVTYTKLDSVNGYVRKFDMNGARITTFAIDNGPLAAPWGLAIAPSGFGAFANLLLVGNAINYPGRSSVNAFTSTGEFVGEFVNGDGSQLHIDNLKGLVFGNGTNGGDPNTLYFSGGTFFQTHGLFGSLKPQSGIPSAIIKFSASDYFANEHDGHFDVTVTRTGNLNQTSTVNYATVDGGQGFAYEIALGKLTFNPGESSKTFRVLIIDDNQFEGGSTTTLDLVLSNTTGGELGGVSQARLSIFDDEFDTPRNPPNTNDDPRLFVREHYLDFLNREPDAAGWDFWTSAITSCTNAQCVEVTRINVSAAFFLSIEFQRTGPVVYSAHRAAFGNLPGATIPVRYGDFMRGVQHLQRNLIFDDGNFETQLAINKAEYFNDFVTQPEFVFRYAAMSNAQYVDQLIQNAGVGFPTSDRDAWVAGLNNGTETRASVLRKMSERAEIKQNEAKKIFVLMEYFGYLRRNPDDPPDNNFSGFNFWLDKLTLFGGDYIRSEMVKAFITSKEYRSRFGPP